MVFGQFFSLDSPKAIKARSFGYMNAINYMAPASTAGVGNVCADASPVCLALCLGWFSGQAGIVRKGTGRRAGNNKARKSRVAKVKMFMHDRMTFMAEMVAGIIRAARKAVREGLALCVRPNGSADIPWEHIKLGKLASAALNVFYGDSIDRSAMTVIEAFPQIQFVDYTKSLKRALRHAQGLFPANYHVTFSHSEINSEACHQVLAAGGNVAVVFAGALPEAYLGRRVVNGDEHDLRHLDPKGGVIIGLSPKGARAQRDRKGFVVRNAA
jgi:hypothetical protein